MRLTERNGEEVWFAHGRPRGFLCPRDFCDNAYGRDKAKDRTCPYLRLLDKLAAYEDAEEQGLLVRLDESMALAMLAGARAIEQNSRKYFGTTFVLDPFGCSKEITYFEAAKKLRAEAEAALKGESADV